MQKIITLLFFFLVLGVGSVIAQKRLLKKADKHYENLAYKDAIGLYEQIVDAGKADFDVYQKLGDSYYYNSDLKNALKSYQKMLSLSKNVPAEYYARTASALKNSNDFEGADKLLKELRELKENDSRAAKLSALPEYLRDITATSGRYSLANIGANSPQADFAPAFYKNELVFSSARGNGNSTETKNKWTGQSYLTLIKAAIMEDGQLYKPEVFSRKLDAQLHESTATFTKDGSTVYFTRNNVEGIGFKTDTTGQVRLKIFRARMDAKGNWRDIEELPFNDDSYSVAHPALSHDETKLYFASDMPGTRGMSDIFKVDINPDGSFGIPANMGSNINTEGRETFPHVTEKGVLYFASDGHLGLGGLDIFATGKVLNNKVINLGTPVNGPADDMTFIIDESTGKGFFASNREGGKGDDDIYTFIESKSLVGNCFGNFQLTVKDDKSNELLAASLVEFKNPEGDIVISNKTDANGMISSNFDCADVLYTINVSKTDYMAKAQDFKASWDETKPSIEIKMRNIAPKIGSDVISILGLDPIFYKLNKTETLDRNKLELDQVVSYLKRYPNVHVKVVSHADSRGRNAYNLSLSKDRSFATAAYLMRNGISEYRLRLDGQGENIILNRCVDNVECEEEEHTRNRRTEFIIVKI
ncbi:flagellar motor protein MotB [Maribacter algarum]|uniref:Flagellar motor protein MotB n=1 Tax=Maribacter algarum (ex Zhang et al. 2020) TaxID=2578118 RepID=A0A5S3PRL8_9FLAO|nr:OmpA family protein [Maribacter algarum]TMM57311.1 flagellar motor protein MotB [Maribacter algarum]